MAKSKLTPYQNEIKTLKKQGESYIGISNILQKNYDLKASPSTIHNFFNPQKKNDTLTSAEKEKKFNIEAMIYSISKEISTAYDAIILNQKRTISEQKEFINEITQTIEKNNNETIESIEQIRNGFQKVAVHLKETADNLQIKETIDDLKADIKRVVYFNNNNVQQTNTITHMLSAIQEAQRNSITAQEEHFKLHTSIPMIWASSIIISSAIWGVIVYFYLY